MLMFNIGSCYKACNKTYNATDPNRLFCKKACDSDEDIAKCKNEYCSDLCIKQEIGSEDDEKKPGWTRFFARAPGIDTSESCFEACLFGCSNKDEEDDD